MLVRVLLLTGAALLHASNALAQTAQIPRPDTLGARFDHATPGQGTPDDYKFLEGHWTVRYQVRDSITGRYGPVIPGKWHGSSPHENLVEDEFILALPSGLVSPTMTYRVFNSSKRVWEVQGVNVRRAVWQPGVSWSDGSNRYMVQMNPGLKIMVRIRYYDIRPDHFLWRADASRDNGKTWVADVMLIEATRIRSQ